MSDLLVPLSQGYSAVIDAADAGLVADVPWHAVVKKNGTVYARAWISNEFVWMHRRIAGAPMGAEVDHRDGDGLNNRRGNLREATRKQNACNRVRRKLYPLLKGVNIPTPGRFQARITVDGRRISLGCFKTEIEAALAYDRAARQWHGEFASLNFPNDQQDNTLPSSGATQFRHEDGTCLYTGSISP